MALMMLEQELMHVQARVCKLGFFENMLKTLVMLHAIFEDILSISRPKCLLESCISKRLETFGTDFSLIGAIKHDLLLI